ncbi:unnamed protein product, partial [marine sediment metagenome]
SFYEELGEGGGLTLNVRVYIPIDDLGGVKKPDFEFRETIFGGIKIFEDGSIGARTAANTFSYKDSPGNKGILIYSQREIEKFIQDAEKIGIQLMIHAIGNKALLIGSVKPREKKKIYKSLENGEIELIFGTHALIEDVVRFKNLGLVTVDEQHRFGVLQRAKLLAKGETPHFLVMTATPIPRTLSMTLYGDLDVSVINEMPPGRKDIITRWTGEKNRTKLYEFIRKKLKEGEQCFIIYPLVEESEKLDLKAATEMYNLLKDNVFKAEGVGLLHGRMKTEEKEKIMKAFREKEITILVSTTVIEVGIDIPEATIMVIEHPERFGLSQLHQMRGRVGRGDKKSYCILLSPGRISDEARERLKTIESTNDGFKIAEKDLQLRGPGEFFGTKQHGLPDLRFSDLVSDGIILQ